VRAHYSLGGAGNASCRLSAVAATASRMQREFPFHPTRPLAISYGLSGHHRRHDPLAPILMKDRPPSAALLQVRGG